MFGEIDPKAPFRSLCKAAQISKASFSLGINSYIACQFDTIVRDDFGTVNLVTRNTKITVPQEGWYIFTGYVVFAGSSNSAISTKLASNGAGSIAIMARGTSDTSSTELGYSVISAAVYCVAGDYVEMYLFQNFQNPMTVTVPVLSALQVH